jgi:Pyridoxamine 5'-phosphate oxidase
VAEDPEEMPVARSGRYRRRDDDADWFTSDGHHDLCSVPDDSKGDVVDTINLGAMDGLPPVNWADIVQELDAGSPPAPGAHNARTTWLSTVNEDGSPHVTAVGALWLRGTFWFQTGSGTRKSRNVARDPRCSLAVSIRDADVVAEGDAARETDPATLTHLAKAWADQGWPAELDETGVGITAPFNAPTQGPPPWNVYRITPRSVTVTLGIEPGGLTRFNF